MNRSLHGFKFIRLNIYYIRLNLKSIFFTQKKNLHNTEILGGGTS